MGFFRRIRDAIHNNDTETRLPDHLNRGDYPAYEPDDAISPLDTDDLDDEVDEFDPDAAMDAYYAAREQQGEAEVEVDAAAIAALDANPDAERVEFTHDGMTLWALPTGGDEFVIRTDDEPDPHEFEAPPTADRAAPDAGQRTGMVARLEPGSALPVGHAERNYLTAEVAVECFHLLRGQGMDAAQAREAALNARVEVAARGDDDADTIIGEVAAAAHAIDLFTRHYDDLDSQAAIRQAAADAVTALTPGLPPDTFTAAASTTADELGDDMDDEVGEYDLYGAELPGPYRTDVPERAAEPGGWIDRNLGDGPATVAAEATEAVVEVDPGAVLPAVEALKNWHAAAFGVEYFQHLRAQGIDVEQARPQAISEASNAAAEGTDDPAAIAGAARAAERGIALFEDYSPHLDPAAARDQAATAAAAELTPRVALPLEAVTDHDGATGPRGVADQVPRIRDLAQAAYDTAWADPQLEENDAAEVYRQTVRDECAALGVGEREFYRADPHAAELFQPGSAPGDPTTTAGTGPGDGGEPAPYSEVERQIYDRAWDAYERARQRYTPAAAAWLTEPSPAEAGRQAVAELCAAEGLGEREFYQAHPGLVPVFEPHHETQELTAADDGELAGEIDVNDADWSDPWRTGVPERPPEPGSWIGRNLTQRGRHDSAVDDHTEAGCDAPTDGLLAELNRHNQLVPEHDETIATEYSATYPDTGADEAAAFARAYDAAADAAPGDDFAATFWSVYGPDGWEPPRGRTEDAAGEMRHAADRAPTTTRVVEDDADPWSTPAASTAPADAGQRTDRALDGAQAALARIDRELAAEDLAEPEHTPPAAERAGQDTEDWVEER
jgi:hypothetical protein